METTCQNLLDHLGGMSYTRGDVLSLRKNYSDKISSARLEERITTIPELVKVLRKREELNEETLREVIRHLRPDGEEILLRPHYRRHQPPPEGTLKESVKTIWYGTLFGVDLISRSLFHIAGMILCHWAFNPFRELCTRLAFNYVHYVRRPGRRHVLDVITRDAEGPNVCSLLLFCLDVYLVNVYRILQYVVKSVLLLLWYKLILVTFSFPYAECGSSVCEARNYIRLNVLGDDPDVVDAFRVASPV